jgi:hypothetical protein
MAGIVVEMSGDEARLFRSMSRVVEQERKMSAGLGKVKRQADKAKAGMLGAFNVTKLASYAGVMGGVLATMRLITAEARHQAEIQRQAASAQMSVAQSRQALIRNLVGTPRDETQKILQRARQMSAQTAVPERFVNQALASAVSAGGGDVDAAFSAVRAAAQFMPLEPESLGGFAGSLLDLSGVTGSKNARTNLGLLLAVGGLSRVTDPQAQAMNIPRSLIGQTSLGATTREAAALFSALTVGAGDITGARSGTAAIGLVEQLRHFQPRGRDAREAFAGMTAGERIQYLQANPAEAQRFLDSATFEKIAQGPIEGLFLDMQSKTAQKFAENLKAIPENAQLANLAATAIDAQLADPLAQSSKLQQTFGQTIDMMQTANQAQGIAGATRQGVIDVLKASGASHLATRFAGAHFELSTMMGRSGMLDQAIRTIGDRRRQMVEGFAEPSPIMTGAPVSPINTFRPARLPTRNGWRRICRQASGRNSTQWARC